MAVKILIVNILTFVRIIGTILLIPIYKIKGGIWAGIFSLICYATDSIDGILARVFKSSTFFGALFDGIADKLFTFVNFIVLYLITPYSIIPIIFELLIVIIQLIKFNKNYNIKSNIIGKLKVWISAISLVTAFFISSIESINIIPLNIKSFILKVPSNKLYFWLLFPTMLICFISLLSYFFEIIKPSKDVNIVTHNKKEVPYMEKNKGLSHFKSIWLNPDFYNKHKNDSNLKDLRKLTKM